MPVQFKAKKARINKIVLIFNSIESWKQVKI